MANKKNGIVVEGENNRTKIIQNHLVAFNGESGIRAGDGAFPLIMMNKIYKNLREGILVV